MPSFKYSQWDGTQSVDPFTADELMQHLADKVLEGGDLRAALRELLQRGGRLPNGRQMSGLRDLLERMRQHRQQQLKRYNMDSVMDDIKEKLDRIIETERKGIERRLDENQSQQGNQQAENNEQGDGSQNQTSNRQSSGNQSQHGGQQSGSTQNASDGQQQSGDPDQQFRDMLERMARRHLDQLDTMPTQPAGRIQQLRDYDFMDADAREQFDELIKSLQQQVMEQYFQGLKQAMGGMTSAQMDQMQEMVQDLNELLNQHRQGNDSGFQDFMNKWGQFFPDGVQDVDQLAQHLQQQMSAMQSLLDSMTPEMRRELNDMMAPLFRDAGLQRDLADLMMNLDRMYPNDRGRGQPFTGEDPVTLQEAMRLMGDMKGLEELEKELLDAVRRNDSTDLDPEKIGQLVGEEARRIAEELQEMARLLEEAGLVRKNGRDYELTPRALRKIGERALSEIFGRIDRGLTGDHSLNRNGWGVERLEETKPYTFGDAFNIDLPGTVRNALRREGTGTPIRLAEDDFEVYRTTSIDQCATVILLDMSQSMHMRGRFQAGRKVAVALDSLIRYKFPRDILYLAAFSYYVLPLKSGMLLENSWIETGGTDFPEAIRGARAMLKKHKEGTKQIIMITDGEPHASSWGYGYGRYGGNWNMRDAMEETLREVARCTRDGIVVNTFMLDTSPVMTSFIRALTKLNKGRIFFADPTQLGEYLIVDYMKNRRAKA